MRPAATGTAVTAPSPNWGEGGASTGSAPLLESCVPSVEHSQHTGSLQTLFASLSFAL